MPIKVHYGPSWDSAAISECVNLLEQCTDTTFALVILIDILEARRSITHGRIKIVEERDDP